MSSPSAGPSSQRNTLPAKPPSRTASGSLRPNPNPQRPHKPPSQHVGSQDSLSSPFPSFSHDIGDSMDIDLPGDDLALGLLAGPSVEHDSFFASILGPSAPAQASTASSSTSKIPYPQRPVRIQDSTPAFGSYTPQPSSSAAQAIHPDYQHGREQPAARPSEADAIADCHPWIGTHNEDTLSDQAVKFGHTEKQRFSNEGNTAKPILGPHLAKGSGLQALSTLLTAAQQQKRDAGLVTSPSTFKPPPRVTLTDMKRESWLRDLSDYHVKLVRLSRTIPHGLRGMALLDHCWTKKVDLDRAVWLVRCVGANELRAFRRKGVSAATAQSNEAKWAKEWTSTVEGFVEGSISPDRNPEAREQFLYAFWLIMMLLDGKLVEIPHILEWLLAFFESAAPERLPLVLLLVQALKHRLTCDFTTSHRLVGICAVHLNCMASKSTSPVVHYLRQSLGEMIQRVLYYAPTIMAFNGSWHLLKRIVVSFARKSSNPLTHKAQLTVTRNDYISNLTLDHPATTATPYHKLVQLLDNYDYSYSENVLFEKCLAATGSTSDTISLAVCYASSTLRTGTSCIFLAASLIKKAMEKALDLTDIVVSTLSQLRSNRRHDPQKMCVLLAQLASTLNLDISRYLRWIMTYGLLKNASRDSLDSNLAARFVRDMPLTGLYVHSRNLRRSLLEHIRAYDDESALFEATKSSISQHMARFRRGSAPSTTTSAPDLQACLASLNMSLRVEVGRWLARRVKDEIAHHASAEAPLTGEAFVQVRAILEEIQSLPPLFDVLRNLAPASDMDLMLHLADTTNAWRNSLRALGRFNVLTHAILQRYGVLRTQVSPVRDTIYSLTRLVATTTKAKYLRSKKLLILDTELCNQNAGAMAFTPASEVMVDSSESAGSLEAEIERLVSSNANMDASCITQVFGLLQIHTRTDYKHAVAIVANSGPLLLRMSDCGRTALTISLSNWLKDIVALAPVSELFALVVSLTGNGVITFSEAIQWTSGVPGIMLALLKQSVARAHTTGGNKEHYRFRTDVNDYLEANALHLLGLVLDQFSQGTSSDKQLVAIFIHALTTVATKDSKGTQELLESWSPSTASVVLALLLPKLNPNREESLESLSEAEVVHFLFHDVDQVSLPLFQVAMQLMSKIDEAFARHVEDSLWSAISSGRPCWRELITGVDRSILTTIRERAEDDLFKALPELQRLAGAGADADLSDFTSRLTQSMEMVATTSFSVGADRNAGTAAKILSQLSQVTKYISTVRSTIYSVQPSPVLGLWANAIMRLALVHRNSFAAAAGAHDLQKLLYILGVVVSAPPTIVGSEMQTFASDVCGFFIIYASAASKAQLRQSLEPFAAQNASIRFFFGTGDTENRHWQIATPVKSVGFAVSSHPPQFATPYTAPTVSLTPFVPRPFEMLQDSTPHIGANDTALSLRLFGARKVPLTGH